MAYFDAAYFDAAYFDTGAAAPFVRVQFSNEGYNESRITQRGKAGYRKAGQLSGTYK